MSSIRILPDNVSNKIAAGEVIERPASVVKELVENSIDSGASKIIINIEKAGRKLISVSDNGCGMGADDAVLSLEPHATSKIKNENDIRCISTMGFRGEALPSIASVSKLKLRTRRKNDAEGTEVILRGGRYLKENPVGCAPGTEIIVADLFFNVPARKKFLKTDSTEEKHIYETVCLLALANYNVAFELKVDGRNILTSPAGREILPRICDFLGRSCSDKLIKVSEKHQDISVFGYVSKPNFVKNTRKEQRFFINRRPIKTPVAYSAISEAYSTMVMKGSFPVTVLYIEIPYDKVDINVHPAKHEARFRNPNEIKSIIRDAVGRMLRQAERPVESVKNSDVPFSSILNSAEINYSAKVNKKSHDDVDLFSSSRNIDDHSKEAAEVKVQHHSGSKQKSTQNDNIEQKKTPSSVEEKVFQEKKAYPEGYDNNRTLRVPGCGNISFLGIIENTFILCSSQEGLIVIDQHAAHERILFEKLLNETNESVISQKLLLPITVELSIQEYYFIIKNEKYFNSLGFDIEDFGNNTVIITAVPVSFPMDNISGMLSNIVEDITVENKSRDKNVNEEKIALSACKFAVKANDRLSKVEAEKLISDLSDCDIPYSCPHGRPTVINISMKELEKRFGRKI
ncbi:MAG: DNA mismatch repair endonuclease MutL [Victivallales bacterium]|nr:DNA mismatch repair endonuclease MutL [Victivallales bacterium]